MAGETLTIGIGANIKDLEKAMREASSRSEETVRKIERDFDGLGAGARFSLGAIQGAIAAISFERITSGLIDANKEIASFGETARRVGLDLVRFQELRLAAQGEGVTGKAFDAGIDGLAKQLNEARREENELTKLLDANNVKYKDRTGEIISTNDALSVAADLISRAATEQDKVDIAKKFGLPKEFVPLLEAGAEALAELARKAGEAGTILDEQIVRKAKEFDDAWTQAWSSFASNAKAGILSALQSLAGLTAEAERFLKANAALGPGLAGRRMGALIADQIAAGGQFTEGGSPGDQIPVNAPQPPRRPGRGPLSTGSRTVIPTNGKSGGGGGGKSDDEKAQERLERYIETLMRQNSVLDAEIATFGKSNAEKRAAVELAKAQVDLAKLDEAERQKIIAGLTREIELSEQKRTQLETLKRAQEGLRDAQKYFGDAAVDALEDLIVNGAKAEDVVKNLGKSLAKAALQATLMGSGPLAGLLGTQGANGSAGGLLGALFKGIGGGGGAFSFGAGGYFGEGPFISGARAAGGPVSAGKTYLVGERGPELFKAPGSGTILPRIPTVSSAASPAAVTYAPNYSIDARGADQAAVARLERGLAERDRRFGRSVQGVMRETDLRGTRA